MKDRLNAALAIELRTLRERAGMTREELAGRLGIHRNTVYNWERGAGMSVPVVLFLRVCLALEVDAGAVLKKAERKM